MVGGNEWRLAKPGRNQHHRGRLLGVTWAEVGATAPSAYARRELEGSSSPSRSKCGDGWRSTAATASCVRRTWCGSHEERGTNSMRSAKGLRSAGPPGMLVVDGPYRAAGPSTAHKQNELLSEFRSRIE